MGRCEKSESVREHTRETLGGAQHARGKVFAAIEASGTGLTLQSPPITCWPNFRTGKYADIRIHLRKVRSPLRYYTVDQRRRTEGLPEGKMWPQEVGQRQGAPGDWG